MPTLEPRISKLFHADSRLPSNFAMKQLSKHKKFSIWKWTRKAFIYGHCISKHWKSCIDWDIYKIKLKLFMSFRSLSIRSVRKLNLIIGWVSRCAEESFPNCDNLKFSQICASVNKVFRSGIWIVWRRKFAANVPTPTIFSIQRDWKIYGFLALEVFRIRFNSPGGENLAKLLHASPRETLISTNK